MNEDSVRFARSADGTRIAYEMAGEGPAIVKINAMCFSHVELYPRQPGAAEFLAEIGRGRTLVRVDMRGSGVSARGCADFSPERLADDLEAVVDAAGVERAAFWTASVQSSAAVRFALRRPRAVSALILMTPYGGTGAQSAAPAIPGGLALMELNWDLFLEFTAQRTTNGRPLSELGGLLRFMRRCYSQADVLAYMRASRPAEDYALAPSVQAPVLVTHRDDVTFETMESVDRMARRFPRGELALLAAEAGTPPTGDPGPLIQLVREFLERVEGTDTSEGSSVSANLTTRELEVLSLLARGLTLREAAGRLSVTESTVSRHCANVYQKLGIHRRAEAVRWALQHGVDRNGEGPHVSGNSREPGSVREV